MRREGPCDCRDREHNWPEGVPVSGISSRAYACICIEVFFASAAMHMSRKTCACFGLAGLVATIELFPILEQLRAVPLALLLTSAPAWSPLPFSFRCSAAGLRSDVGSGLGTSSRFWHHSASLVLVLLVFSELTALDAQPASGSGSAPCNWR